MKTVEFGTQNKEIVLMLHGGGFSWWNYREAAMLLQEDFHVVLPILDGHSGSDAPFVSIEESARRLIAYIDETFGGQVAAIGGLSLGGQIGAEMLSQRPDICRCALLESVLVKPMPLTHALIGPAFGMSHGLIRKKWFSKLQFSYYGIKKELFDDYYRDSCGLTRENLIAFLKANSDYRLKTSFSESTAKLLIAVGGREQRIMRNSARRLHEARPDSTLATAKGFRHGELSLNHPQLYVRWLRELMADKLPNPENS